MSIPWKPRTSDKCWTFYMIDDLLLHLGWFRGAVHLQEQVYIGIRPLTASEERQSIPELDLDACLSLLFANLSAVESQLPLKEDTIGLVRALVRFDPTETATKVRALTDAQNLVDLICYLNKKECFKSWFGPAAYNATRRLALEICGRVPLLPRSLFLNVADLDADKFTYQGKAFEIWSSSRTIYEQFVDEIVLRSLSHDNIAPYLGICADMPDIWLISPESENGTLREWRQSINPSVSKIQQIVSFHLACTVDVHTSSRFLK
ncbi:hypothetical protein M378DRAFT_317348 [Amanita muscaria Koide BX008]|uniref:Uncharacterized protein n=1 Tax=Amanita muscaria (strain Koide BX008) TaxID=946122 RepID=A0A0C2WQB6_AMAMK|nr:hypothetical protein M378DRAFT_317348 [Amanita muscaria Koide BX008]